MLGGRRRSRLLGSLLATTLGLTTLAVGAVAAPAGATALADLTGRMVTSTGTPLRECSMYVYGERSDLPGWAGASTTTDPEGLFVLPLPPGQYEVTAYCWDVDPDHIASFAATVGTQDVSLGDVVADAVEAVTGTVTGPGGQPVAGVRVEVLGGSAVSWATRLTEANGTFYIPVPPGDYELRFQAPFSANLRGAVREVTVPVGGLSGVDVALAAGQTLSGRVTSGGAPVAGAALLIETQDLAATGPAPWGQLATASDGSYTATGLAPGSYTVSLAWGSTYAPAEVTGVVVEGQPTTGVDLAVDTLAGKVTGSVADANGAPLAEGVAVAALGVGPSSTGPDGYTSVDAGGSAFSLTSLRTGGAHVVGVNRQSGQSLYTGRYYAGSGSIGSASLAGATQVTAASAGTAIGQTRLDTCASVTGRIADLDEYLAGIPYDEVYATVVVFNDDDPDAVTRSAPVAADGSYTVTGLLPGEYYGALNVYAYTEQTQAWSQTDDFFGGADPGEGAEPSIDISGCAPVSGVNFGVDPVVAAPTDVVPVTPVRLVDDRAVPGFGAARCATVAGAGAPPGATGVIVNVASASPASEGNVVLFPHDGTASPTPPAAGVSVNFEAWRDVANAAFVKIGANGQICWYSQSFAPSRVVVDVVGFTLPDSGVTLQASQRLVDTRPGPGHVGELTGGLVDGTVYEVKAADVLGVPADAKAVVLNVAVVNPGGAGHLRVYPADGKATAPDIATVNYAPGRTKSNGTVVSIGLDKKIALYSRTFATDPVHVVLDVTGYVGADGQTYQTVTPERVLDTRSGAPAGLRPFGTLAANTVYSLDVRGTSVVPDEATGVVLNVTAIGPTTVGNLRVYPDANGDGKTPPPGASAINYIPGRDVPNLVVVGIPADGRVNFYSNQVAGGQVNLAVDVVGYLTAPVE